MMIPNQSNVSYIQPRCAVPNQFIRQNTPPPNQSTLQLNSRYNYLSYITYKKIIIFHNLILLMYYYFIVVV